MEELFLTTEDNVKIAINHTKTDSNDVLIIVHGWFMTKDSKPFLQMAEMFSKYFSVISMDCRGHGKSSGKYTFTADEEKDLKTVVDYAKQNYENIYLAGFSLGGALVLLYAAKDQGIKKIISISPPSDFKKIENYMWHPNAWIPTFQKFEYKTWISVRPDYKSLFFTEKCPPLSVIDKIQTPVMFVAGEKDKTVCPWHTKLLYEKALCKKKYELLKNSIHAEDLFIHDPKGFVNLCTGWLLSN